ncbi:MAG: sigma-70 family RNA polymerase sigma factor [Proteobacteria bacterium]|uniref:sigma-70 family RNA polymerase sigma factor n=1 Tax=Rudaea sp. TaxID=2136325 RepID=UPI003783B393|nr:sigma-70 family RNA polymerase sigma factor [Pseudomonadota bacterium]
MTAAAAPVWIGELALCHLDAAYNLGRWLLGNEHDAADAVHDAFLRAARAADTYAGGNARAWWLAIVRNCCLARLETRNRDVRNISIDSVSNDDDAARGGGAQLLPRSEASEIEDRLDQAQRRALITRALHELPTEFRETLILREIEELSYREIADVLQTPIGTVMSRLARGRALLQKALAGTAVTSEVTHGL